ncbi:ATP-binding protein [Lentibacter sp. XHP0401]|jgi:two-component system, OmpR family, osmolarity sensor histidine kinase EnvZ|uniref:ATP-binding protein n=1 Tax=Lentibacter sp. XHP0401 TaxID=2984334 RepID=UPI0021E95A89|nr:ATP-binding protein [Lentibacter sp. XHP0401]MCV2892104.1 ATP-binding protein [Lentibacter sp. XHP0401]
MFFGWLKQYMPRSLYGRAALILIVPIIGLQLVVSIIFIQRHFEDVTTQMTRSMALELRLVLSEYEQDGVSASATPLEIELAAGELIEERQRWYDFSGFVVRRELLEALETVAAVDMPDGRTLRVGIATERGPVVLSFNRLRVSASNPHQLLVYMLLGGILMTMIAYIYLRNQLRPIKRLARAAAAFGRGQVIEYRPSGAVEVRAAGHAFLDMRNRIERQIEQRTLMLSGVSHDLRTPLTRMKLGLALLEDEDREPLERDVTEMQRLVDEFLSFAKGAAEGEAESTDPFVFIREIVEDCARAGQDVSLGKMDGEGDGTVNLRRIGIRRAVENLVGNAVRYGNRAVVSVALTERALRIRVEDDGPGIAARDREEALRPFARLDAARNQNKGSGVGLGLSIAMDVARAHGGMLRLGESTELGGLRADIVIGR